MGLESVKPIHSRIMFQFIEDIDNKTFQSESPGGIALVEDRSNQVSQDRWGKVLKLGHEVDTTLVSEGEYILIEALGWTNSMTLEDSVLAEKFWFTDIDKVICVSEDCPN